MITKLRLHADMEQVSDMSIQATAIFFDEDDLETLEHGDSPVFAYSDRRDAMVACYRRFGSLVETGNDGEEWRSIRARRTFPTTPELCAAFLKEICVGHVICGPHGDGGRFDAETTYPPEFDVQFGNVEVFSYYYGNVFRGPRSVFRQVLVCRDVSQLGEVRNLEKELNRMGSEHGGFEIKPGDEFDLDLFTELPKLRLASNTTRAEKMRTLKNNKIAPGTRLFYDPKDRVAYLRFEGEANVIVT